MSLIFYVYLFFPAVINALHLHYASYGMSFFYYSFTAIKKSQEEFSSWFAHIRNLFW